MFTFFLQGYLMYSKKSFHIFNDYCLILLEIDIQVFMHALIMLDLRCTLIKKRSFLNPPCHLFYAIHCVCYRGIGTPMFHQSTYQLSALSGTRTESMSLLVFYSPL